VTKAKLLNSLKSTQDKWFSLSTKDIVCNSYYPAGYKSDNKLKMKLQNALSIADGIVAALSPNCEIINVAGSCRRKKPEVGDIEIVCVPKRKIIKPLFGDDIIGGRTKGFVSAVELLGKRVKGSIIDGKNVKVKLEEGIIVDMWLPDYQEFYRHLAIRTGSSDYSARVIATGWRKKGWCGSDLGLRKISDCIEHKHRSGSSTWKCVNVKAEQPPQRKSEQEFFDWLGIKWVEPASRNI
jgi:DNA polymerase/3'-5' exonuclease PolX